MKNSRFSTLCVNIYLISGNFHVKMDIKDDEGKKVGKYGSGLRNKKMSKVCKPQ